MKNKGKVWDAVYNREKLPRKIKKLIFGKSLSKKKLRNKISKLVFENDELVSKPFCPKCGCNMSRGTGNMSEYPEHWEDFYCIKCKEVIGTIDNSRFVHVLESDKYRK